MTLSTFEAMKNVPLNGSMKVLDTEEISQLKEILLEILLDVHSFCEAKHLEYALGGGSCLGSVRHKGFIPWDDDVDIMMPRCSYEVFLETFEGAYDGKYVLNIPGKTKGYALGMAHVRKTGTIYKTHSDFEIANDKAGIFIDIFPIENVPDNWFLRKIHEYGSLTLGLLTSCNRFYNLKEQYLKLAEHSDALEKQFMKKIRIGSFTKRRSMENWAKKWDSWNSRCKQANSRYVTIPSGRKHYNGELLSREVFFPAVDAEFEGHKLKIPANADAYLKSLYGDYMKIPPVTEREKHVVHEFSLGGCPSEEPEVTKK